MSPQAIVFHRVAPVLGALLGLCLGCAGAKHPPNVWFDACCQTCGADHCEACTDAGKRGCTDAREAECMLHAEVLMCRPAQRTRH
jgi:hypothetical protein